MNFWLAWMNEGSDHPYEVAKAAEAMGFKGVVIADHVAIPRDYRSAHPSGRRAVEHDTPFPDALITLAGMAAATTTLKLMPYIYVLPMREPFSAAKQAATLALHSGNRLLMGIGAGWLAEEVELLGHSFASRGARMDEMITIMRDLWDDGEAEFSGEHFSFGRIGQYPVPEKAIPILVGGKSPAAIRRAARNDGWLGMNYPMDEVEQLLAKLDTERQRWLDANPMADKGFYRFVIGNEPPGEQLYDRLGALGVDGTIASCWDPKDPASRSLDAKLESMERFAAQYINRS